MPPTSPVSSWPALTQIISTGIPGLDAMFNKRGLYQGSSILISGGSGAGKTTIGNHFIDAACERGERCILFGFEEGPNEHCRNAMAVGIDLNKWIDADLLRLIVVRPNLFGLETHVARIHHELERFNPSLVVIDPISAFLGHTFEVHGALQRILNNLKSRGTTAVFTSLLNIGTLMDDALSSLMDTWIKLVGIDANGERNRVLYVMKARGLSHSNQVREYRMTDTGFELITAYIGPDGVLTGSARLTQEAHEQAANSDRKNEIERRQREVLRQKEILVSQITVLRVALEEKEDEAAKLLEQNDTRAEGLANSNRVLSAYRATP
jgi:circadian clock protein KaiC